MVIKLIIISVLLVGLVLVALATGILVKKHGRFPDTHVGSNPEMRKKGISCAKSTDIGCRPEDDAGCFCSAPKQ